MGKPLFVHDVIRMHLLENAGAPHIPIKRMPDLESLKKTEQNKEFRKLCQNRFIMGAFRYGLMGEPGKARWDRVQSAIDRLKLYQEDGNAEHLVDAANLCELEFDDPNHKNFHFSAADDKIHTKEIK
jgi:hypothetical protein